MTNPGLYFVDRPVSLSKLIDMAGCLRPDSSGFVIVRRKCRGYGPVIRRLAINVSSRKDIAKRTIVRQGDRVSASYFRGPGSSVTPMRAKIQQSVRRKHF